MRSNRYSSPLPPGPIGLRGPSPLPPGPIGVRGPSPLPPNPAFLERRDADTLAGEPGK